MPELSKNATKIRGIFYTASLRWVSKKQQNLPSLRCPMCLKFTLVYMRKLYNL